VALVHCTPQPPAGTNLASAYTTGELVEFGGNTSYSCSSDDVFFEAEREREEWNITCQEGGAWTEPGVWPRCIHSVNCSAPPARTGSLPWAWTGSTAFTTVVHYTCGPYGQFLAPSGSLRMEAAAECLWNRTWSPPVLDPCVSKAAPTFPPPVPRQARPAR
jgi:hypothetical protein